MNIVVFKPTNVSCNTKENAASLRFFLFIVEQVAVFCPVEQLVLVESRKVLDSNRNKVVIGY